MTDKQPHWDGRGWVKQKGWYSWRHRTNEANIAAREEYQYNHGKKARQRKANERMNND